MVCSVPAGCAVRGDSSRIKWLIFKLFLESSPWLTNHEDGSVVGLSTELSNGLSGQMQTTDSNRL